MLFLFFIFICIVSGTTFVLAPYGQTGVLLFILLLFVAAIGLFLGTIASLGVTLVLQLSAVHPDEKDFVSLAIVHALSNEKLFTNIVVETANTDIFSNEAA